MFFFLPVRFFPPPLFFFPRAFFLSYKPPLSLIYSSPQQVTAFLLPLLPVPSLSPLLFLCCFEILQKCPFNLFSSPLSFLTFSIGSRALYFFPFRFPLITSPPPRYRTTSATLDVDPAAFSSDIVTLSLFGFPPIETPRIYGMTILYSLSVPFAFSPSRFSFFP